MLLAGCQEDTGELQLAASKAEQGYKSYSQLCAVSTKDTDQTSGLNIIPTKNVMSIQNMALLSAILTVAHMGILERKVEDVVADAQYFRVNSACCRINSAHEEALQITLRMLFLPDRNPVTLQSNCLKP